MSDRRSPEFPLLFLHAAARYLALRRVMQREGSTPATMYCATAAAPALPDDFLSTLLQAAGLADPEADTLTPRAHVAGTAVAPATRHSPAGLVAHCGLG